MRRKLHVLIQSRFATGTAIRPVDLLQPGRVRRISVRSLSTPLRLLAFRDHQSNHSSSGSNLGSAMTITFIRPIAR
jgi:hypothetical protein